MAGVLLCVSSPHGGGNPGVRVAYLADEMLRTLPLHTPCSCLVVTHRDMHIRNVTVSERRTTRNPDERLVVAPLVCRGAPLAASAAVE
jgi:hypothetical protein